MADNDPYTYTLREQKFASLYAQGVRAADAARQAGYSPSYVDKKAYLLPRRPRIQALVSRYRQTLGVLNADVLDLALSTMHEIINDPAVPENLRFQAARELIDFYQATSSANLSTMVQVPYPSLEQYGLSAPRQARFRWSKNPTHPYLPEI